MKKRYMLPLALALAAVLCILLLTFGNVCIGRIETHTDSQWGQLHMYLNGDITVDFPITEENTVCVFQSETGRGTFHATITDAQGRTLYSDTTGKTGSAVFLASSDLKLRIHGKSHGGTFSLIRRDDLTQLPDPNTPTFRLQGEGTHTGGTFTQTFECWKFDGQYLNFYVENKGTDPVFITVNGEYQRQIDSGSAGHISAVITATTFPQDMTVKCTSDEELNIYWKAAQRSSKSG